MKKTFMYLFILSLLFNVFTYMYYSKKVDFEETRYKKNTTSLKDSLNSVSNQLSDANYFTLEKNQNAQNYFATGITTPIDYVKLIPELENKLMSFNDLPDGNPYTGQQKLGTQKFIINKLKVLNHRWIVADYSDGEYWGEVFIKYFVNEDGTFSFEVIQSLIYQK